MKNYLENKSELKSILQNLVGDEKPEFGMMSAQHMVEHLTLSIQFSNGVNPKILIVEEDMVNKIKYVVTQTENEISPGFKTPVLPYDKTLDLIYNSMDEAIDSLLVEVNNYENYKKEHPNSKPINPVMGELDWNEWDTFHNKHIRHHLRQFRFIE